MEDNVTVSKDFLPEKVSDADLLSLERANLKRQVAQANAQKAIAESETAEMTYKTVVMQIFMKYKMNESDTMTQEGVINRTAGSLT